MNPPSELQAVNCQLSIVDCMCVRVHSCVHTVCLLGKGTVLAVANSEGLAAVGVEICLSRVNNAKKLNCSTLFNDRVILLYV
jgi:hypothetical protein